MCLNVVNSCDFASLAILVHSNCTWRRATPAITTRATCRQGWGRRLRWRSPSRATTTTTAAAAAVAAVAAPWWHPVRAAIRTAVLCGTAQANSYAWCANTSRCRALCCHAGTPASAPRASANSTAARCAAAPSRATFAYAARSTCRRRRRSTRVSNVSRATGRHTGCTTGTIDSPISWASPDREDAPRVMALSQRFRDIRLLRGKRCPREREDPAVCCASNRINSQRRNRS